MLRVTIATGCLFIVGALSLASGQDRPLPAPPGPSVNPFAKPAVPPADRSPSAKSYDDAPVSFGELVSRSREYQTGDLITWEDAKPYLDHLEERGVTIPDDPELADKFLSESDRVVKMLRTRKGTHFARQLLKSGGNYDMLDHFRKLPHGYASLQLMIDTPRGHQLLAEMVTTKTGRATAAELARVPGGADFDKPSGLIYTEDQLHQFLDAANKPAPSGEQTPGRVPPPETDAERPPKLTPVKP
jgi:hypothetical protein